MKYFFAFTLLLMMIVAGCKPKILAGKELEDKLIETMTEHLHKTLKPGTEFTVKDVIYYPEASQKLYYCEFHVNMNIKGRDTTGLMKAMISNDFNTVERRQ